MIWGGVVFRDRVSPCGSGYAGTRCVDQTSLSLEQSSFSLRLLSAEIKGVLPSCPAAALLLESASIAAQASLRPLLRPPILKLQEFIGVSSYVVCFRRLT